MTTIFSHRKMLHCRAVSAAGNAPILRHAGNGATSQFHTTGSIERGGITVPNAVSGKWRKRLNSGNEPEDGAIDLQPARRLLYKSPRRTEVEPRC